MKHLFLALAALLIVPSVATAADPKLVDQLQTVSVTIKAGYSQGSGVLFTRKQGNQTVTFVWTAAHVVDGLRETRKIVDPDTGTERTVVEFSDATIVQEFTENGRRIGEIAMDAKLIRYSDFEKGQDLALLEVRKRNFVPEGVTVKFYDGEIPKVGTELIHVGSLLGQVGANSATTGIISQIGRVIPGNDVVYDQTTATAFPGSSGGGVFLADNGQYVGMLVRGAGETFNLIVPARRLRSWAKAAKIEWAIDSNVPLPSDEERAKIRVEDTGVTFRYPTSAAADKKSFPFLIERPRVRFRIEEVFPIDESEFDELPPVEPVPDWELNPPTPPQPSPV